MSEARIEAFPAPMAHAARPMIRYRNLSVSVTHHALALLLWVALLASGCSGPQASETDEPSSAVDVQKKEEPDGIPDAVAWSQPFLWEVRAEEGGPVSYLFGTVHLGFDLEKDGPAVILERFAECRRFVTETDLTRAPLVIGDFMYLPEDQSLSGLLGEEDWQLLADRIEDPGAYDRYQPFVVVSQLLMELPPERNPFEVPMDTVLLQAAIRAGYKVVYLEPVETQFEVLEQVLDVTMLREMLRDWDSEVRDFMLMTNAYRRADVSGVQAIIFQDAADPAEKQKLDLLLDERNVDWMPTVKSEIEAGGAFIAVGAGHLVGENGLLRLLEQEGFVLKQVPAGG